MFCNGPRTDEGDIARLELTTIAGMTSLKVLFVLDHDCGQYRWFGWAHQYAHCNLTSDYIYFILHFIKTSIFHDFLNYFFFFKHNNHNSFPSYIFDINKNNNKHLNTK